MKGMTGRDLMIYILANGLEDEPLFKNGRLLGFLTESEAAAKFGVGRATIQIWIEREQLDAVKLGGMWYIPQNATNPLERNNDEENNANSGGRPVHGAYGNLFKPTAYTSTREANLTRGVSSTV